MKNPFKRNKKDSGQVKKTPGFFPWQKDKAAQKQETVAAFMTEIIKHLPAIKEILRPGESARPLIYSNGAITAGITTSDSDAISPEAERTAKLYDFYVDYTGHVSNNNNFVISGSFDSGQAADGTAAPSDNFALPEALRMSANPKDVLHELEQFPAPEMLEHLDEKINTLNDKSLMTNQQYASDQIKALIKRLENRRKYHEYESFYKVFPNTNDEKIDNLLKKYKLVVKTIDIFVPTFPKEAIDVMKEYTRVTKEVCGEEPVYYVIAEESDFKEKFKKLDPILLVQSPFGFWWQVLGAWDKEMLLLSEL